MFEGHPKTSLITFRAVEKALDLPDNLLDLMLAGDITAIAAIPDTEIRPGMKRNILAGLSRIDAEEVEGHEGHDNNKHTQAL